MLYIGLFPIGTIGLGMLSVYSDNLVPKPPAKIRTFICFYSPLLVWEME